VNTYLSPVRRAATCFGDRVALVDATTGSETTFRQLETLVLRIAGLLDELGVGRGERVAVLADGGSRYAQLYLGVPAAGRVVVPLNTRYTREELEAACRDCTPMLLLVDRQYETLTAGLADVVIVLDDEFDRRLAGTRELVVPDVGENEPAAIFYTGGTTDRAKGVCLSHRNKLCDSQTLIIELELSEADRWLVMSPMFHAAGSFNVLPCVWVGATQVFLPRFDAENALRTMATHAISLTFGVPIMLDALADAQQRFGLDVSSLRLLGHGGAQATQATLARTISAFPDTEICAQYGATEMAPLATVGRHQERRLGTPSARAAGRPAIGVDVTITGPEGSPVGAGETGEVTVTGPNIMLGYWGKPEATAEVLAGDAYRSGDLGYLDGDGLLYIVDRKKDMIISGGENVFSVEVEDVLSSHPDVVEAAVLGEHDERWGEVVTAVIVGRSEDLTHEALDVFCHQHLAGYKCPRRYTFRQEPLPRTAAGKLLKRNLRPPTSGEGRRARDDGDQVPSPARPA